MIANLIVILGAVVAAILLSRPTLLKSSLWRATVTPLASIIGSGFLVLAPLLVRQFGGHAVWAMLLLCLVGYWIGAAIRYNIGVLDSAGAPTSGWGARLEQASQWALAFAYVISVCYYLNLFGAFALSMIWPDSDVAARGVTSAALIGIAVVGWTHGLRGLERVETLAVAIKLTVIAGLLAGMLHYTFSLAANDALQDNGGHVDQHAVRLMFGLIITVQGFETSRYLGDAYDANTRIRSMRYAQWLATAIYVLYIGLAGLDFAADDMPLKETAVIGMTEPVASLLPFLLVLAALAAQLSAAVADTNGCGGLAQDMSRGRLKARPAYLLLTTLALLLTWSANIYEIISYASRAFAVYYALQCAVATLFSVKTGKSHWRTLAFALLTLLLVIAALFGLPAE